MFISIYRHKPDSILTESHGVLGFWGFGVVLYAAMQLQLMPGLNLNLLLVLTI